MVREHRIENRQAVESLSPAFWETVQPIQVDQYLWEDNGYQPEVQVRLFYTAEKLYVHFKSYESDPLIRYQQLNEPVHADSCVEFFIQPSPDTDDRYLNFEINAAGTLLLGLGSSREREKLYDIDPALFDIRAQVNLKDPNNQKTYWELQYAIPASFIQEHFPDFNLQAGTIMRGNFYKCGDDTEKPHYGCWNLVRSATPEYHRKEDFGTLILS